jgi:hypothetical protein
MISVLKTIPNKPSSLLPSDISIHSGRRIVAGMGNDVRVADGVTAAY